MKIDAYGLIVSESCAGIGQLGDSCAESSRYLLLSQMQNKLGLYDTPCLIDLTKFKTEKSWCRHPLLEQSGTWVNDIPTDQLLPWFIATSPIGKSEVFDYFNKHGYQTPNGDIISPMFWSAIKRAKNEPSAFYDLSILFQAYFFKLPIRCSYSKGWFESSEGSWSDVLNWLACIFFAFLTDSVTWPIRKAMRVMTKEDVKKMLKIAYLKEPNPFVVGKYEDIITKIWL